MSVLSQRRCNWRKLGASGAGMQIPRQMTEKTESGVRPLAKLHFRFQPAARCFQRTGVCKRNRKLKFQRGVR